MLAPRKIPKSFLEWNYRWRAPFGRLFFKKFIPAGLYQTRPFSNFVGMFSHQPNSDTRIFEYPWAYSVADLRKGMRILDIGGGFSGFPFVLSKLGIDVVVVDPFLKYGPMEHYGENPEIIFNKLNSAYNTKVILKRSRIEQVNFRAKEFDRIFCISVLEHMTDEDLGSIRKIVPKILKKNGLFILSVDLFLNLMPFATRDRNEFGRNISIKKIVDKSGLVLVLGNNKELCGYDDFDTKNVLSNLENYLIGRAYPALIQCAVLKNR